jgi:hypothetical protein
LGIFVFLSFREESFPLNQLFSEGIFGSSFCQHSWQHFLGSLHTPGDIPVRDSTVAGSPQAHVPITTKDGEQAVASDGPNAVLWRLSGQVCAGPPIRMSCLQSGQ